MMEIYWKVAVENCSTTKHFAGKDCEKPRTAPL